MLQDRKDVLGGKPLWKHCKKIMVWTFEGHIGIGQVFRT